MAKNIKHMPFAKRLAQFEATMGREQCWLWPGSRNPVNGYVQITIYKNGQRRSMAAHRRAYELLRGPIPDGLTIDHLCCTRHCLNPWHMEPLTLKENTRRALTSPTTINANKTHCLRGHPLSGANLVMYDGKRRCRACFAERSASRDRKSEAWYKKRTEERRARRHPRISFPS